MLRFRSLTATRIVNPARLMASAAAHPRPSSPATSAPPEKKPRLDVQVDGPAGKRPAKRKRHASKKPAFPESFSNEDVLWRDIVSVLGKETVEKAIEEETDLESPFQFKEEVEVEIKDISSSGEGLGVAINTPKPWVVVVPFSLPGEKVLARVYRQHRLHSVADFVKLVSPNPALRDDSIVRCRYFTKCGGCQYQMLPYDTQLDYKRNVVVKAYANFSDLPPESIPTIEPTIGSPLQYGYRTKITPHFEAPPKRVQKAGVPVEPEEGTSKPSWLKIGFNQVGTRHTMDIEECPIATPVLNEAYGPMRENIIKNIHTYKKGVSLLLRDSLERSAPSTNLSELTEKHLCITDHNATVRERVGDMIFEYPGGSFFQNNNSVLVPLTTYVRDAIFSSSSSSATAATRPTHLVDAYCGSGLFAITLSPHFETVAGVELSTQSIASATQNATLNSIPSDKISFRSGDASSIFATVQSFPRSETTVIIDPPRKGSDEQFIDQLVEFGCKTVVYVSCNVHTQARDVGMIIRKSDGRYKLKSIRGFDLFPQTAHVESVAVLEREME